MKKLTTGVVVRYKKNGNIDTCISIYDNAVTSKPLGTQKGFKAFKSYQPLTQDNFNNWSNKHL